MKTYIGVKIVQAEPCTLGAYNGRRGWKIPPDEDPQRAGYFLRYPDGYQSWSPREIFEGAYRLVSDDERALVLPGKRIAPVTAGTQGEAVAGEAIDENVRVTGGGHSETPIPFSG